MHCKKTPDVLSDSGTGLSALAIEKTKLTKSNGDLLLHPILQFHSARHWYIYDSRVSSTLAEHDIGTGFIIPSCDSHSEINTQ